ncbi:uncharacterized protein SPSK_10196 [Sporothrix schenckii 1099-18]|uniref:Uncharacterized protein n=1 Tax=Sporothrix schenckii 1099-18 TaxID=1397361 RepID=A0A0F2M6K8_SPOSC|nr:uncharacterized protein SPSK_10196 [Sporothrix schenckii 1099-18]KJR84734.1 hypothetical protein SPSK_10196 [Sporothrix schenckii 1099-18]
MPMNTDPISREPQLADKYDMLSQVKGNPLSFPLKNVLLWGTQQPPSHFPAVLLAAAPAVGQQHVHIHGKNDEASRC